MNGEGPSAEVARYALVRAARRLSEAQRVDGYLYRPQQSTPFQEQLADAVAQNHDAATLLTLCNGQIDASAATKSFRSDDIRPRLDQLRRTHAEDYTAFLSAVGELRSLIPELPAETVLWDRLTALLVTKPQSREVAAIVDLLRLTHVIARTAATLETEQVDRRVIDAVPVVDRSVLAACRRVASGEVAAAKTDGRDPRPGHRDFLGIAREYVYALAARELALRLMATGQASSLGGGQAPVTDDGPTESSGRSVDVIVPLVAPVDVLATQPAGVRDALALAGGVADPGSVDLPLVVGALERRVANLGSLLFGSLGALESVRLADGLQRLALGLDDSSVARLDDDILIWVPQADRIGNAVAGQVEARIKPGGISDLKIVRQQLYKYDLGEIAHIENVLAGEERERTHTRLERTEQQLLIESEESSSSERDLATTERFELSQEMESLQKEQRASEAGVTVTASYGAVSISAHAGQQSTQVAESAEKASRRAMKETVARAVERVQKKTRRQQTVTMTFETTEANLHRFAASKEPVVGVYRWVEKHYWCQVLSYGARLMIEFLVPEPAAYYSHAMTTNPRSHGPLVAPDEPGISAAQITEWNYRALAAKYGAAVAAPPPSMRYAQIMQKSKEDSGSDAQLTIEDGYEAVSASATFTYTYATNVQPPPSLQVIAGRHRWDSRSWPGTVGFSTPVRGEFSFKVYTFNINGTWTVGMTVVLQRTDEALQKWQLATYTAIMDAYRELKDEYDKKLAAQQTRKAEYAKRTDHEYRTIERQELRRAALELLRDDHFDNNGAINTVGGLPTIDNDAALREGPVVRFFEQAFEWSNMVYTFYPYYWARKAQWGDKVSSGDADPVFARFLNAGYARVVVPVRRQFEAHIAYFIETGTAWSGADVPLPDDEDYLSIIEEIKEIDRAAEAGMPDGRPEGEPWRVVLPTPLVCLDSDRIRLPSWESRTPTPVPYRPSQELCDGVPYNAAQWPDRKSVVAELKLLGYEVGAGDAETWLATPDGRRVVRAFQTRANELGVSSVMGRRLRVDGVVGPCTLRALSEMAQRRLDNNWPGPT